MGILHVLVRYMVVFANKSEEPHGNMARPAVRCLRQWELVAYLRKYGESIYRTHGGPWLPKEWGGSTFREDTVYIHVCNPQVREILLPKVNGVDLALDKVLTGQKVEFRSSATNIQIRFHSVEADKPFVMRLIASRSLHPDDIIRE